MPLSLPLASLRPLALRTARSLALGAVLALVPAPAQADLPEEGDCPAVPGGPFTDEEDALRVPLREGMTFSLEALPSLRRLLPPELWRYRDAFFFEGMRLVLGPCHRRYGVDPWYEEATRRFAGEARVDEEGNLHGYRAGLPFPPDAIESESPQAGAQWAWNLELRYRGSGPVGSFRLVDLPSRLGAPETYLGHFFLVVTRARADLPESGYALTEGEDRAWVAGGRFDEPFNARQLAWRQMRPASVAQDYDTPDDTFVYVPTMRKTRRAASAWVSGIYVPSYTVSGTERGGGGIPTGGGNPYGPAGSVQPTAGASAAITQHIRKGFVGLSLRPNAYRWKLRGERDVLAPLNSAHPGYPTNPERNFGPSGLSLADDRWEIRRAVVLEGLARDPAKRVARLTLYVDAQTQQLLYWIGRQRDRRVLEAGILAHRYSGDLPGYPEWPGHGRPRLFDPVAAAFYSPIEGGTGWRRESYGAVSVPVEPGRLRDLISTDSLAKGR